MPVYLTPAFIVTAAKHWEVAHPEALLRHHREWFQRLKLQHPSFEWPAPHQISVLLTPFVNAGRWMLQCPCGDYPIVEPQWHMACCFQCGRSEERRVGKECRSRWS